MDKYNRVIQDVTAIVDSIGDSRKEPDENGKDYRLRSDSVECIKELIRMLKRDGSLFPILRHLGAMNIVEKDLLPIVRNYFLENEAIGEYTLRLLNQLTYPALMYYKEKMPDNVEHKRVFLQINGYLRVYKTKLSRDVKVWKVLIEKALSITAKNVIDQSEEEKILLERILIFIRNILHVPIDTFLVHGADDDEMIAEDMIITFKESGVLDALIKLSSHDETQPFCFHLLEIITSLLRAQSPEFLTLDEDRSSHVNKKRKTCAALVESEELDQIKEHEKKMKNLSRFSRFNRFKDSTYLVKNFKSVGENDLIYHKTTEDPRKISMDIEKAGTKKPKNRAPMQDDCSVQYNNIGITFRRPSIKVRKLLKEFCSKFVKESYNSLMAYVKSALENKNAIANDETYYFFTAHFFMEFNRHSKGDPSDIEETFNTEYFHYLHTKVEEFMDQIANARSDRVSITAWSRRLHIALKAYKELLFTIASIKHAQEERLLYLAKTMSDKVFYELDYRELLLNLISGYDEKKMSPQFLRDLIETNHVFLKMLDLYSKSNENFVVKTKKKKRRKPTAKKKKEQQMELVEKLWQEIVFELDEAIQGKTELPNPDNEVEVLSFNVLSEETRDAQKEDALYRISKFLKQRKILLALALCRNAREEYNDYDDTPFGAPDLSPEEEVAILHRIIATEKWIDLDMEEPIEKNGKENAVADENIAENQNEEELADKEKDPVSDYEEEKDGENNGVVNDESAYQERAFYLRDFVLKYCNSKVVKAYCLALKKFDINSEILNHAILRMAHRIALDCKSPVFFFQLSVFRIFQRCFEISKLDRDNKFSEIRNFARFIIKEFVSQAKGNDKLLVEILFWKNKKEMHEIEENYVKPEPKERKRKEKKGRKGKKGEDDAINSTYDSDSGDDRPGNRNDDLSELSDDADEFNPKFQSTQIPKVPEEKSKSPDASVAENNPTIYDEVIDVNYEELQDQPGSLNPYDLEDDDLIDMDEVINQVAADDDSLDNDFENDVNNENSIIGATQNDLADDLSDAETIDGEVIISKRKKNIVLDDSDDD
ncbi:protein timeless homolog [Tetranychus urticae]|uniref:Timeless N-terminal domain-containing protein n=1 Tax=Tetranychus urticae TaxID=32264 RepID=T1KNK1_TETUR|nr:protein timeless homolog [Tetranychus urticae]